MRSAARITWSGRKSRIGVFLARICLLIDALQAPAVIAERHEDPLVALGAGERVEEHDRPVELVVDVDRGDGDELEALVVDAHAALRRRSRATSR